MPALAAIASALPILPDLEPVRRTRGLRGVPASAPGVAALLPVRARAHRPVLQFVPFPVTIDPRHFAGAQSNANPAGAFAPLRAFRDLVDPLPGVSAYYSGQGSTEDAYRTIVAGADAGPGDTLAQQVLADCRKRLADHTLPDYDGSRGTWGPVYATPGDWADDPDPARFQDLTIDLAGAAGDDGPYAMVGGVPDLALRAHAGAPAILPDGATRLRALRMKCLLVTLSRPWFNSMLFTIKGWRMPQQPEGYCSSGTLEDNAGVMPLVPAAVLLGRDIALDADWSATDRAFIDRAAGAALGPFALGAPAHGAALQVVAWVSALTPLSPVSSGLPAGSVLVANHGAFSARFALTWRRAGQAEGAASKVIGMLGADSVAIPADAQDIVCTVEVMTVPPPLAAWRTLDVLRWEAPADRRLALRGTLVDASLAEIQEPA